MISVIRFIRRSHLYAGVARYRASEDPSKPPDAYKHLRGMYPESVWTTKASVSVRENIEGLRAA